MDLMISQLIAPLIILGAIFLIFITVHIVGKWAAKGSRTEFLMKRLHAPIHILLILALLFLIFKALPMHVMTNEILDKIFTIAMIIGFGYLAMRCVDLFTSMILSNYEIRVKDNYEARKMHTRFGVIKRLAKSLIIAAVVVFILMSFKAIRAQGMNILASAGVVGIIVGFAAQKTLASFFTGLQIAIAQPIRLEDVVIIENECGTIEEIRLTYVVVKLWDLRRLIVPVSFFTEKPFQNWTQKTADLLAPIMLYVDHAMPIQPIREELDRILKGNTLWDGKVKVVHVVEILEHALQVRILTSAANSGAAFELRCNIREQLMAFMQKNYPQFLPRLNARLEPGPPKSQ